MHATFRMADDINMRTIFVCFLL
uniref:Uncharacterized protein n=1 Tax=Arundo donax TaxID=35708 RepID=A0A0A8YQP1_ARUDO